MEPSWYQNGVKNRCQLRKAFFSRNALSLQRGLVLQDQEGRKWEQKWTKNRAKNGVKKGRHLGIDFSSILVDLKGQVGTENRPKIDPKRHWRPLLPLLVPFGRILEGSWPVLAASAPTCRGGSSAMRRDPARCGGDPAASWPILSHLC